MNAVGVGGSATTDSFSEKGWARLEYRFAESALNALSNIGPHVGRGKRLSDMNRIEGILPCQFKSELDARGFHIVPQRAVGFRKTSNMNWSLPWHQDRVIVMPERLDDPSLINWSQKSGGWHCEPPVKILENMAFVYLAFDSIGSNCGGLQIAEGSHQFGKIDASEIEYRVASTTTVSPNLERGEALLVSALTLHRSGTFSGKSERKTLRLDFNAYL